jgi:DNA-binding MarR family transcriptional regulator
MARKRGPITLSELQKKDIKKSNPIKDRLITQIGFTKLLFPNENSIKHIDIDKESSSIKIEPTKKIKEKEIPVINVKKNGVNPTLATSPVKNKAAEVIPQDHSELHNGQIKEIHHAFFRLPCSQTIQMMKEYDSNCFVIYLFLSIKAWGEFCQSPGIVRASLSYITKGAGVTPATVKRSLKKMIEAGHLKCLKTDFKNGNLYQVKNELKQLASNGTEGRYLKFNYSAFQSTTEFSASSFIILLYLTISSEYQNNSGLCGPISSTEIAKETNLSLSTVERSLSFLKKKRSLNIMARCRK